MVVCFLLTHVPNPRINKRIEIYKKIADVHVICARRKSQNIWEPSQDVNHIIIDFDLPTSKHILQRAVMSRNFQSLVYKKLVSLCPDLIYAEGLDCLSIADKYKKDHRVKVVFEVADLRESYIEMPKSLLSRVITKAVLFKEKHCFKSVNQLVVTSPKFYELHYYELIDKDKVLFIPNIPDSEVFRNYKKKTEGQFTVGFIGGIRYIQQMKMLVDAANRIRCNVLFAGAGGSIEEYREIQEYCKGMSNVVFTGKYNYDTEIANLYGLVDCVYAVYDASNPNVRIALPNKLYESIICELPIIVSEDTYLSELVTSWGIGVSIDCCDLSALVETLKELKDNSHLQKSLIENIRKLKNKTIMNNNNQLLLEDLV